AARTRPTRFPPPPLHRSASPRLWATSAGIDPYATAVSDIYQDLFGAGTFTGKGIYEVDAFERATGSVFPDNHILSHDLIEGNFARCGLVTDIELFDDFPVRYHAYARREPRWVRGDWQLLPWLGRCVPCVVPVPQAPDGTAGQLAGASSLLPPKEPKGEGADASHTRPPATRQRNPLPLLERWKVFDNLRRSLVPAG